MRVAETATKAGGAPEIKRRHAASSRLRVSEIKRNRASAMSASRLIGGVMRMPDRRGSSSRGLSAFTLPGGHRAGGQRRQQIIKYRTPTCQVVMHLRKRPAANLGLGFTATDCDLRCRWIPSEAVCGTCVADQSQQLMVKFLIDPSRASSPLQLHSLWHEQHRASCRYDACCPFRFASSFMHPFVALICPAIQLGVGALGPDQGSTELHPRVFQHV